MSSTEVISIGKSPININLKGPPAPPPPTQQVDEPAESEPTSDDYAGDYSGPEYAPPPVYDDPKIKYKLIGRANAYFASPIFGAKVAHLRCDLNSLDNASLERLVNELDICINVSMDVGFAKETFYLGVNGLENFLKNKTRFKADGLNAALRANPSMDSIIEALRLKYSAGQYVPPEVKLVLAIGSTVWVLDAHNRAAEVSAALALKLSQKEVPTQVADRYKDL